MLRGRVSPPLRVGATTNDNVHRTHPAIGGSVACAGLAYPDAQPAATSLFNWWALPVACAQLLSGGWPVADRIDRALAVGESPFAIEQDVAWSPGQLAAGQVRRLARPRIERGRAPWRRTSSTASRPLMERALAERQTDKWPVLVLHLDFKTNEPEHHRAVWDLLVRPSRLVDHGRAARRPGNRDAISCRAIAGPHRKRPGQEAMFFERLHVGDRLLLFGTTPSPAMPPSDDPESAPRWRRPHPRRRWCRGRPPITVAGPTSPGM